MSDLDHIRRILDVIERAIDLSDDIAVWPGGESPIDDLVAAQDKVQAALAVRESRILPVRQPTQTTVTVPADLVKTNTLRRREQ